MLLNEATYRHIYNPSLKFNTLRRIVMIPYAMLHAIGDFSFAKTDFNLRLVLYIENGILTRVKVRTLTPLGSSLIGIAGCTKTDLPITHPHCQSISFIRHNVHLSHAAD